MASDRAFAAWVDWVRTTGPDLLQVPVAFENEAVPGGTRGLASGPFILVELAGQLFSQASLGAGDPAAELWREEGQSFFHIFVPQNTGAAEARRLASLAARALKGARLGPAGDLTITDMRIGDGAPGSEDGAWWRLTLAVSWHRDETN